MTTKQQVAKKEEVSQSVQRVASPLYGIAAKYHLEPGKLIEVLRGTVLKPDKKTGRVPTNEELAALCVVAQQYDLNPFTREIYGFLGQNGGIVPIVGIDGYVKIVNRQPDFNGFTLEEVEGDNGKPAYVTCTMHIKGRENPVVVTERFAECVRDTGPWRQMPWRMLRHKAYMQAARYAFGLGGIHDEDEARDIVTSGAPIKEMIDMPRAIGENPPPSQEPDDKWAAAEQEEIHQQAEEERQQKENREPTSGPSELDLQCEAIEARIDNAKTTEELPAILKDIMAIADKDAKQRVGQKLDKRQAELVDLKGREEKGGKKK
jgi:phage recombination protein Bet